MHVHGDKLKRSEKERNLHKLLKYKKVRYTYATSLILWNPILQKRSHFIKSLYSKWSKTFWLSYIFWLYIDSFFSSQQKMFSLMISLYLPISVYVSCNYVWYIKNCDRQVKCPKMILPFANSFIPQVLKKCVSLQCYA